ncbi:MAG: class I SAM-dependent methyltransferase [Acidimicrobiia bacterium]|nr:class I SAM-dependent methyltransferase [Acidimicrobiia bacterium]
MPDLPDYVLTNRELWDTTAHDWVAMGERAWTEEPSWGIWGIPETDLRLLPDDMTGMRTIELGCGTAYVSEWMIRRGAEAVGIDNSEQQIATARRLADEHGAQLELIHGNAETVPYPDESFDFAISEYGVAIWADPYKWVPEAWRVLRPGGHLVMLGNHPLVSITQRLDVDEPTTRTLLHPYFGMHRIDWDDGKERGTEFNLTISEWHRLWANTGFEFLEYLELRSPAPGNEVRFFASADWAHDYPTEHVWKVRKRK